MRKSRDQEYADALDELDRMRQAGQVTDGQYEVQRQKLLAEMNTKPVSWPVRFILIVVFVIAVIVAMQAISGVLR